MGPGGVLQLPPLGAPRERIEDTESGAFSFELEAVYFLIELPISTIMLVLFSILR